MQHKKLNNQILCGGRGIPKSKNPIGYRKNQDCLFCLRMFDTYEKVKNELGKVSDRSIAKKFKTSERFLRRIRKILNIPFCRKYIKKDDEYFIPLNKKGVTHIEVSNHGNFRNKNTHKKYVINVKNNFPFIRTRNHKYSASLLVYCTFSNIRLQNNQTIGFRDGNPYNLKLANLYIRRINRQTSKPKIFKQIYNIAQEWAKIVKIEDTIKDFSVKINKSRSFISFRTLLMKKFLKLDTRCRFSIYEIIQKMKTEVESGEAGGKNHGVEMSYLNFGG